MKRLKKTLVVLMAIVIAVTFSFAVVGCGGTAKTEPGLEGVTFNERTGEMYKDTKEGKTRIKITYSTGFGDNWIRQIARDFLHDDLGSSYYFVLDGDSEVTTGVSSKLESGLNLSDIYMVLASNWYSYVSLGYLENLDDLYKMTVPGEDITVGKRMQGAWTDYGKFSYQEKEGYYLFPWNENVTGIVYNKTMFDKYGWEVPETTAELKALCQQIVDDTDGKIAPFVYPGTITGGYWDFVGTNWWLQVSGVEKLNAFMEFVGPEVFEYENPSDLSYGKLVALETFEDIIVKNRKEYTLSGSGSKDHKTAQLSFVQGQAAMIPTGNWVENESMEGMKDEARMKPTPIIEGEAQVDGNGEYLRYNYSGQPDYIMIPSAASNKEGAKLFLAYMCKDEVLKKYTTLTGTPRPFDYDISECETSEFIKSCLDIWSNSTTWFESSTSLLWTANKVRKYNSGNPYTQLLANADTKTAIGWCADELTSVTNSWDTWLEQVGLK